MEYSNPEIPEGINTSKEHPLKEFVLLASGVLVSIFTLILILVLLSDYIVGYIPFSWEKQLSIPFTGSDSSNGTGQARKPIENYLQGLADKISTAQKLPEGMTIKVHYLDSNTVNAFATLGGHVFFFRGLLEKIPHENALAMVMAHEIAHVKYRHPIQGLGRGVVFAVVMSVISSAMGDAIMQNFFNEAGYLTVLKFNRDMETDSDEDAIQALLSIYGHLDGAEDLFKMLQKEHGNKESFEFLNTHPLTENRISNIQTKAKLHQSTITSVLTPVPDAFRKWLTPTTK